jgi:uncharacterized protein with ParB-like and HNH nuclease domain
MPGIKFDFVSIGELLKKGRLEVPPNQRSYAWEEQHVRSLLTDLSGAISANSDDYFLGTIVLVQPESGSPLIADGQQRIATMTILLCRIRDKLVELNRSGSAQSLDQDFLRNIDRDTEAIVPRIRLNLEDNDYFVRRVLLGPRDPDYTGSLNVKAVRSSNERLQDASDQAARFIEEILATVPATSC